MSGLRLGKLIAKAKKGPVPLASTRHIHTRLLSGLHWIEYLVILLSPKGRETQRRLLIYSQDEQASSRQGWQCNRPQSGAMVACMAYRACRLRCGVKVLIDAVLQTCCDTASTTFCCCRAARSAQLESAQTRVILYFSFRVSFLVR